MELYKWYKGNELPDRECDCVVVCEHVTQEFVNNNPDDVFTIIEQPKYVTHVVVASDKLPRFIVYGIGMLNNKKIIAWMPIEFPSMEQEG